MFSIKADPPESKPVIAFKNIIDLNAYCRLCMSLDPNRVGIFDDNENLSLPLRIMACVSLEINQTDQLPKHICKECRYQLEKSFLFRRKSKNSDTKLRRYQRLINSGKAHKISEDSDDEDEYADSLEFFAQCDKEKFLELEKEKIEQENLFEARLQATLEEERRKFYELESKRIVESYITAQAVARPAPVFKQLEILEKPIIAKPIKDVDDHETIIGDANYELETYEADSEDEFATDELGGETLKLEQEISDGDENIQTIEEEEMEIMEFEVENTEHEDEEQSHQVVLNKNLKCRQLTTSDQDTFSILSYPTEMEASESLHIVSENNEVEEEDETTQDDKTDSIKREFNLTDTQYENIVQTVQNTIAMQLGRNTKDEIKFRIESRVDNTTQVEIEMDDGSVILLDIELYKETGKKKVSPKGRKVTTVVDVHKCTECAATFSIMSQLRRHQAIHTSAGKGDACKYCEKWFPTRSALLRHERLHTGEKPFVCEICERSFTQKEILKRHLITHSGQKPFVCPHCLKQYGQAELLKQHINSKHSGAGTTVATPHKCQLCPKEFAYSSGLSRHFQQHRGKHFACNVCEKMFNDQSALKRHIANVHYGTAVAKE